MLITAPGQLGSEQWQLTLTAERMKGEIKSFKYDSFQIETN